MPLRKARVLAPSKSAPMDVRVAKVVSMQRETVGTALVEGGLVAEVPFLGPLLDHLLHEECEDVLLEGLGARRGRLGEVGGVPGVEVMVDDHGAAGLRVLVSVPEFLDGQFVAAGHLLDGCEVGAALFEHPQVEVVEDVNSLIDGGVGPVIYLVAVFRFDSPEYLFPGEVLHVIDAALEEELLLLEFAVLL